MARRPRMYEQQAFEAYLRQEGYPESMIPTAISESKLLFPLLLRALGAEKAFAITRPYLESLGLKVDNQVDAFWRSSIEYAYEWTEAELTRYLHERQQSADSPDE